MIRERAQIAVAYFLNVVKTLNYLTSNPSGVIQDETEFLQILAEFKDLTVNKQQLYAADFAAAVQLLIEVAQEEISLVARSRSAGMMYSGMGDNDSDVSRVWGRGSWQQRLAGLLYGTSFSEDLFGFGGRNGLKWSRDAVPYADVGTEDPRIWELLSLARSLEAIAVGTVPLSESPVGNPRICQVPDETRYGLAYERTKAAIQEQRCIQQVQEAIDVYDPASGDPLPPTTATYDSSDNSCNAVPMEDVLEAEYGIDASVGQGLGRLLAEVVGGSGCITIPGQRSLTRRVGTHNIAGKIEFDEVNDILLLSGNFELTQPTLVDIASAGARGTTPTFGLGTYDTAVGLAGNGLAREDEQVVNISSPMPATLNIELMRRMGVASVIGAAQLVSRQLVRGLSNPAYGDSETKEILGRMLDEVLGTELQAATAAAVGESTVYVRPRVSNCSPGGAPCPWGNVAERKWDLSIPTVDGDPVLDPGGGSGVLVVAVWEPWIQHLLAAAPGRVEVGGTTALDVVTEAAASGNFAQLLHDVEQGLWRTQLPLDLTSAPVGYSDDSDYALVLYHGTYLGLVLNETPEGFSKKARIVFSGLSVQNDLVAGNGAIVATGGTLGVFARQQLLPSIAHPESPLYDGFGVPQGWVPPFSAELFGGSSGESSVQHFLSSARQASERAETAVTSALGGLLERQTDVEEKRLTGEQRDAALEAAAELAQQGMKETETGLCGSGNESCNFEVVKTPLQQAWYPALDGYDSVACRDAFVMSLQALSDAVWLAGSDPEFSESDNPELANIMQETEELEGELIGRLTGYSDLGDLVAAIGIAGNTELVYQQILGVMGIDMAEMRHDVLHSALGFLGWDYARSDFSAENDAVARAEQMAAIAIANMTCNADRLIKATLSMEVGIAPAVAAKLGSSTVPAFDEFSGGELQGALIEQWRALKSPNEKFSVLLTTRDAAAARIEVANSLLQTAAEQIRRQCSVGRMEQAFNAGFSYGFPSLVSWSPGPLNSQKQRCEDAMLAFGPQMKEANAENKNALASFAASAQGVTDLQAAMQQSAASIVRLQAEAKLAKERVRLEERLAKRAAVTQYQNVLTTSFGMYRRFRDHELWRAKAMVEVARRQALVARRAIESQFAIDLSQASRDEAFVVAPRVWADEVYEYDLSLPASLGLELSSEGGTAVSANKVADYVTNLEQFIAGYTVSRPSAVADNDIDVITLPGLSGREQYAATVRAVVDETAGTVDDKEVTAFPTLGAWEGYCEREGIWKDVPSGSGEVATLCQASGSVPEWTYPTRLRLAFTLDPWGQLNGQRRRSEYSNRYNARWTQLAVNLVGTGVLDCSEAPDNLECYSRGYVRYTLRHSGSPWVTDYNGRFHAISLPEGIVEGGKAIALERWLEPLVDGWSSSYISAAARSEFAFRPLGGQYLLELEMTPDLRAERIERVQLLAGTHYWIAQEY